MLNYIKHYPGISLIMFLGVVLSAYYAWHDQTPYLLFVSLGAFGLWFGAYEIDKNKGTN